MKTSSRVLEKGPDKTTRQRVMRIVSAGDAAGTVLPRSLLISINAQDKVNLLVLVRDLWLDANAHSHAYDRALRVSKQRSDWLKLGTIVSALLTAATGFVETVWLTVVIGLLTTALASIERLFLPAETYSKQSECKYKLEGLKRKLTSFSMTLDAVPDLLAGNQSLDNMGNELIDVKREMAVWVSPDDSKPQKMISGEVLWHIYLSRRGWRPGNRCRRMNHQSQNPPKTRRMLWRYLDCAHRAPKHKSHVRHMGVSSRGTQI